MELDAAAFERQVCFSHKTDQQMKKLPSVYIDNKVQVDISMVSIKNCDHYLSITIKTQDHLKTFPSLSVLFQVCAEESHVPSEKLATE